MNIVKQSTGNVVLTDAAGNIQKVFVNVNALDVKGTDEVVVKFGFNQWHSLFASKVQNTEVEPAAAVAFSGDAFDLVNLLSSSFFFKLSGGGGNDLATVLIAGNTAGANDIDMNNNDLLNVGLINGVAFPQTLPIEIQAAASDETTALTTGTAKVTFRLPAAFTLTDVRASLTTAQASGSIFTVDINQGGSSVLGTKLTIDNTEKTSVTAATPATITTSALTDDAEITIDIDQIGNGTATGLKITLIGTR